MFTENRSRRNEVYLFDTRFRLVSSRYFAALSKYSRESGDARSSVVVGSLHCARGRAENATLETSHRQLRLFRRFNRYSTCPPPLLPPPPPPLRTRRPSPTLPWNHRFVKVFLASSFPEVSSERVHTVSIHCPRPPTPRSLSDPGQSRRPVASHAAPTLSRSD